MAGLIAFSLAAQIQRTRLGNLSFKTRSTRSLPVLWQGVGSTGAPSYFHAVDCWHATLPPKYYGPTAASAAKYL